jgi:hypothetical protein
MVVDIDRGILRFQGMRLRDFEDGVRLVILEQELVRFLAVKDAGKRRGGAQNPGIAHMPLSYLTAL